MSRARTRAGIAVVAALAAATLTVILSPPAEGALPDHCAVDESPTVTCTYRGGPGTSFEFVTPEGVTSVHLRVVGDPGRNAWSDTVATWSDGGRPAVVEADVPTFDGDRLLVEFRDNGGQGGSNSAGGGSAGGGGGSTAVLRVGGSLVAEAGGGGGAGWWQASGTSGGSSGNPGDYSSGGDAGTPGQDAFTLGEGGHDIVAARGGASGTSGGGGGAGAVADVDTSTPTVFAAGGDGGPSTGGNGGVGEFGGGGGGGGTVGGGGGGAGGTGTFTRSYGAGGAGGASTVPPGGTVGLASEFAVAQITYTLGGHAAYSPTSLDFGSVPVGSRVTRAVTVTNAGPGPTIVYGAAIIDSDSGDFGYGDGTCSGSTVLPVGDTCEWEVSFRPQSTGASSATLRFEDTSGATHEVALRGVGTRPLAAASPLVVDFGSVQLGASSAPREVVLSNSGDADLSVDTASLSGDGDFVIASDECSRSTIPPGHSCSVTITFRPSAFSNRSGSLRITHNALGGSTVVPLSGAGITQADLKVLGAGSVYTGRDHLVTRVVAGTNTLQTYPLVVLNEDTVARSYRIRIDADWWAKAEVWSTGLSGSKVLLPYGDRSFITDPIQPGRTASYSLHVTPMVTGHATNRVQVFLDTDFGAPIESVTTETNTAAPANGTSSFELFARQGSQAFIGGPTAGQTTTGPALNVGGSAGYTVRLKNNGTTRKQIGLRLTDVDGCAGSFAVSVTAAGKVRTADAYAGTFLTPLLAPGGYQDVQVSIRRATAGCPARMVRAESLDGGAVVRASYLLANAAYDAATD